MNKPMLQELIDATTLTMGADVADLYRIGDNWCRTAFDGALDVTTIRILAMPHVIGPYNKSAAFHTSDGVPSADSTICFYRHYIDLGMGIIDGQEASIADTLLHELCHAYQNNVSTETRWRDVKPHRDGRWLDAVRVASSNLWGGGVMLPIEHFVPRRKNAWFSDVEMHHYPAGFETKIKARMADG